MTIDWTMFEDNKDEYLENIPVKWIEGAPVVFADKASFKRGTVIRITKLQRRWTPKMMERLSYNVEAMTSPFSGLKKFNVDLQINDEEKPELQHQSLTSLLESATYKFEVTLQEDGSAEK